MFRGSPNRRRRARGDILFGPMFFLGILAAIAIPAYQDYTIRSQVTEGLNLASAVKASAAEYYATNGKWPANLAAMEFGAAPRGKYSVVTMTKGTVIILYGRQANSLIAGHRLTLRPTTNTQGDVIWSCGFSEFAGVDPRTGAAAPHATDIARKYLPKSCRGN